MRFLVMALVAACYSPSGYRTCEISCAMSNVCPGDLSCGTDGLCYSGTQCNLIDAAMDDGVDAKVCIDGPGFITYCPTMPLASSLDLVDGMRLTDPPGNCYDIIPQAGGPDICVVAVADMITIKGTVTIVGPRPALIAARSTLVIEPNRIIDVSRGGAGTVGLTTTGATCTVGTALGQDVMAGAAGGGGASFMTAGGFGGPASGGVPTMNGAIVTPPPTVLRGGCSGGTGGMNLTNAFAIGGRAGGAIYLLAGSSISSNGQVHAFGAGGLGTNQTAAGGGGGASGGMIVLDAPTIMLGGGALLLAAGGGGGQGSNGNGQTATGGVQNPANPTQPAPGGNTAAIGSKGGNGSEAAMSGGAATSASGGGGGGGGGGYIKAYGSVTGSGVSAPPLAP